jgi:hypothetical protein
MEQHKNELAVCPMTMLRDGLELVLFFFHFHTTVKDCRETDFAS